MKILHTSDWHLGHTLYGKKRYAEFQEFLAWMLQTIQQEAVDILLIAGDIFDTSTPSNRTQELYYQFLCKVSTTTACQHIVIIGGNHDSPTLLNAPKTLLQQLKIHVIGSITTNIEDELLVLNDINNKPMALVCAVPYLRDSDIRSVEELESQRDKNQKLITGIKDHYAQICDLALQKREQLGLAIPILGLGHLFTTKGLSGDGVRDLYVGTLAHFDAGEFPAGIDYLALGHLHLPQKVNNLEHIRYSGSPLAMGFGEIQQHKSIFCIEFAEQKPLTISSIAVPQFQKFARISGTYEELSTQLTTLATSQESIWLEVTYTGNEIVTNLHQQLQNIVSDSQIELIKVSNRKFIHQVSANDTAASTIELQDLSPLQVFEKCLEVNEIPLPQQQILKNCYAQIMTEIATHDARQE